MKRVILALAVCVCCLSMSTTAFAAAIAVADGADVTWAAATDTPNYTGTLTTGVWRTTADGQDFAGATVANAGSIGTLTVVGSSSVTADIGTATNYVNTLNLNGDGDTVTFSGHIYAGTINFGDDATATIAGTKNVTANITTGTDGEGTLTLSNGGHTVTGSIGTSLKALKKVNAGTGTTAFTGDIYADNLEFSGNGGYVTIADGKSVSGTVTATVNDASTLGFLGSSTISNDIGASGGINLNTVGFNGGTITLGADIFSGEVGVTDATVNISGDRTIGGDLGLAAGTGSSILNIGANTLTVSTDSVAGKGEYSMAATTTLKTTISSETTYGNIQAVDQDALVNSGSTVDITVGSCFIRNGTQFTIINGQAAGVGVDAPTITDNSAVLTFAATGDNQEDLVFTATRVGYNNLSSDGNGKSAGVALENAGANTHTADMTTVLTTLDGLTSSQINSALDTVVPLADSGVLDASTTVLNDFVDVAIDRAEGIMTSGFGKTSGISAGDAAAKLENSIWAKGYGSYLTQGTRKGIKGYDAGSIGTAVGADHKFMDTIVLGISGGWSYGNIDSKANNGETYINSAQTTVYGGYINDVIPVFIDAAGVFAWNWYNGKRDITVGSIARRANAEYNGQQYGAYLGAGYNYEVTKQLTLVPLISLQYSHLEVGSYTETEAGALNLSVGSQGYDILQSGIGGKAQYAIDSKYGKVTPSVRGKWYYDFIGDNVDMTGNFAGGGASFTTNGAKPAQSMFNVGTSILWDTKYSVSLALDYDVQLKDEFVGQYGAVTAKYTF